jgi:hypothetical protein
LPNRQAKKPKEAQIGEDLGFPLNSAPLPRPLLPPKPHALGSGKTTGLIVPFSVKEERDGIHCHFLLALGQGVLEGTKS